MVVASGPASVSKAGCCCCFQRKKRNSITLSEIYCRTCTSHDACAERAPLGPLNDQCACTRKIQSLLNQSEYEVRKEHHVKNHKKNRDHHNNANTTEFEFADDAISLNGDISEERPPSRTSITSSKSFKETSFTENPYINVNGKEELPCAQEIRKYPISSDVSNNTKEVDDINSVNYEVSDSKTNTKLINNYNINFNGKQLPNFDSNYNKLSYNKIQSYCTLPKQKHKDKASCRPILTPPQRITPDGTHIFYWCDFPKKSGNIFSIIIFFHLLIVSFIIIIN